MSLLTRKLLKTCGVIFAAWFILGFIIPIFQTGSTTNTTAQAAWGLLTGLLVLTALGALVAHVVDQYRASKPTDLDVLLLQLEHMANEQGESGHGRS